MPAKGHVVSGRVSDGLSRAAPGGTPQTVLSFARGSRAGQERPAGEGGASSRNPAQRAVMLMLMGLREPVPVQQKRKRDRQLELPFDDPPGPPAV